MGQGRKHVPESWSVMDGGKPGKPKAPKSKPTPPPEHLSERAKATWVVWEAYLRGLGLFQPIYGVALEEACELRAELIECRQEIAENGRWYTTTNKAGDVMRRPHPAQGQLADSQRRLVPFLSEFGLTPVGRAKLLAMKVDEDDSHSDPSEAFFGK